MATTRAPAKENTLGSKAIEQVLEILGDLRALITHLVSVIGNSGLTARAAMLSDRPVLLTSEQFAERWGGVTAKTVDDWCRNGRFPFARPGGKSGWRIPEFYLYRDDPPPSQRHWYAQDDVTLPEPAVPAEEKGPREALAATSAPVQDQVEQPATAPSQARCTDDGFDLDSILDYRKVTPPGDSARPPFRPGSRRRTKTSASAP